LVKKVGLNMNSQNERKQTVANGGKKAAVEAGMVAKNGGDGVDGGESGDDLTEEKDEQGEGDVVLGQEGGLTLDIGD